ncbi:Somatomedin-B and thrombospondin type-1 domain-containing protein [Echinococcus granulosus]|uniref:RPE spondin n=1 Tax=Echinococcus granulosus TaxID=6210 RepID=A0A068WJA6_ECHGR|nr:Somatomedin-B and thrombospondin type-1 domain-containing protein [Echinococcus granulosus]CDS19832.1 RPE spondin [Echinococcus granulosus]
MQANLSTSAMRLVLLLLLLTVCSFNTELADRSGSCRNHDGNPICCTGRANCRGVLRVTHVSYSYTPRGYRLADSRRFLQHAARCFCDEYCLRTNDCCWDYRDVCAKPKINCGVSAWSRWSPCNRLCGKGNQTRTRSITREAANGGDQCPLLMESRTCSGFTCNRRRVGRSEYNSYRHMELPSEVANLLPVDGDIEETIKQFDMRWDIRRKLYYGRLIQQNKTDIPDPEPYSAYYEIIKSNDACKAGGAPPRRQEGRSQNPWGSSFERIYDLDHPWLSTALLRPGQQICATCYPKYMRPELGNRCPGTGYPGLTSRWRALNTFDCQGTFRMISHSFSLDLLILLFAHCCLDHSHIPCPSLLALSSTIHLVTVSFIRPMLSSKEKHEYGCMWKAIHLSFRSSILSERVYALFFYASPSREQNDAYVLLIFRP